MPINNLSADQIISLFIRPAVDWSDVQAVAQKLLQAGQDSEQLLIDQPDFKLILNARIATNKSIPEQHNNWHDLSIYLVGSNELSYGGILQGAQEVKEGEFREGSLLNSEKFSLTAGDLLMIPAGIPHQNNFTANTVFVIAKILKGQEEKSPVASVLVNWQTPLCRQSFLQN